MAILWGRRSTREELLARVGRLEQVAGIRLIERGGGAGRPDADPDMRSTEEVPDGKR